MLPNLLCYLQTKEILKKSMKTMEIIGDAILDSQTPGEELTVVAPSIALTVVKQSPELLTGGRITVGDSSVNVPSYCDVVNKQGSNCATANDTSGNISLKVCGSWFRACSCVDSHLYALLFNSPFILP